MNRPVSGRAFWAWPFFILPPEQAHACALALVRLIPSRAIYERPRLASKLAGISLPHPVGLAAGFDKNAKAFSGFLRLGLSFVEVGTITPRPQLGNVPPRLFRLTEDKALINHMGFNNDGLDVIADRLSRRDRRLGIVGANIGLNKDSIDWIEGYIEGIQRLSPFVDYLVINISSPNTPGLSEWQHPKRLVSLLFTIGKLLSKIRDFLKEKGVSLPLFLKLSPDLTPNNVEAIVDLSIEYGIDGLILTNTTIARPYTLRSSYRNEEGGLSGDPLFDQSTRLLRDVAVRARGRLALIGVGGIDSAERAYAKIRAGASVVQIYTGLIYEGPSLLKKILDGLERLLDRDGLEFIQDAIGLDCR